MSLVPIGDIRSYPASALLFQNHALSVADDLGDSFDYTFLDESF